MVVALVENLAAEHIIKNRCLNKNLYTNVQHYLQQLKGGNNLSQKAEKWQGKNNPNALENKYIIKTDYINMYLMQYYYSDKKEKYVMTLMNLKNITVCSECFGRKTVMVI